MNNPATEAYFTPEFLKQAKKYRHLKKLLANRTYPVMISYISLYRAIAFSTIGSGSTGPG